MAREVREDDGRVEGEVVSRDVGGVGVERSQWRIEPSEPPETRIGWTGCHATAVKIVFADYDRRGDKKVGSNNIQQTSFLCPFRTRNSFIARMSKTRTL